MSDLRALYLSTPFAEKNFDFGFEVNRILTSIHPTFGNDNHIGARKQIVAKKVCYDSGGFQFLMRDLELPTPEEVIAKYHQLGLEKHDLIIQLDLPPSPKDSADVQRSKINKTAENFFIMQSIDERTIPVVHGWTKQLIDESIETFLKEPNNEIIATPSNIALEKKIVAATTYAATEKQVIATTSGTAEEKQLRVKPKRIYSRFGIALKKISKIFPDSQIFALGAGSPNFAHLSWISGATYCDGSSWRTNARYWQVMIPGESSLVGYSSKRKTGKKPTKAIRGQLKEILQDDYYPLQGLTLKELEKLFYANGSLGFRSRAIHNAYVLIQEQAIANEFNSDSDGYLSYLERRWRTSQYWLKRLRWVQDEIKDNYVQSDLEVFFR